MAPKPHKTVLSEKMRRIEKMSLYGKRRVCYGKYVIRQNKLISSGEEVNNAVKETESFGGVDIMVHNATVEQGGKKMKKQLKKAAACMCITAIAVSMAVSCGKKDAEKDGVITISVGDIPAADVDPRANQICMERIAEFEKNNPDIKIEADSYSFAPDTYAAMAEAGTLPTTYYVPFTQSKLIMDMEYSTDITEAFKKYGLYDKVSDTILEKISKNGKIYLAPYDCYDSGMVLNMKLFKEAGLLNADGTPKTPQTWEELAQTAETIKKKTGKAGLALLPSGWRFMNIAWSYGGEFVEKTPDGKWKAIFDSPEVTAALQYVKDLKWKYNAIQENVLADAEGINQLVGTGQAAMMFGEPGTATKCMTYGMDIKDVGMMQMPAGPKKRVTLIGGTYSVIKKGSTEKEIDAVIRWLQETGTLGTELNDKTKKSIQSQIDLNLASNVIVGAQTITPWNSNNPVTEYRKNLEKEQTNINLDFVKEYNNKNDIEFHEEVPVAASPLYRTLGNCIQEVLTNENADCAELLKQAAHDFQKNQLDNIK